jgi:acetyl esterase/lipase
MVAAAAWALALLALVTAYYMLDPVDYGGVGRLGWAGFLLGPRILLATAVAAVLAVLALLHHEVVALAGFVVVALATLAMVLVPGTLVWRQADRDHVSLSLLEALAPRLESREGGDGQSVVYAKPRSGRRLELDVWRATGGEAEPGALHPAIVKVHGGAWIRGTRSGHSDWNRWLNRLGYVVFDVEYTLPPHASWRSEVADIKCALGWVRSHASTYRIDPSRISTMGYSAGGNLALLAAYAESDARLPASCNGPPVAVRSVINLYGPTDLPELFRTSGSRTYIDRALERYVGGTPSEFPGRYRDLSPVSYVSAGTPPTITLIGGSDRIIPAEQARILDRALARARVPHPTYVLPATDHGFDVDWHGLATQLARGVIERFLARYG